MNKARNTKIVTKVTILVVLAVVITSLLVAFSLDILLDMDKYSESNGTYHQNAIIYIISVSLIFEAMIISGGYYCIKAIKRPLAEILKAIKIISDGGVEVDMKKYNNDEFGTIIDALNVMAANVKHDAEIAEIISTGDLSMDVEPRTDIDVLGKSFNKLLGDHNHVLGNIREASMQVTTGSAQVASASQSLAQGSAEQASGLEEISGSIEEIAQST